jgi:DNA-binding MarR family transcriptional regulator
MMLHYPFEDILAEILQRLHKNGNNMLKNNLKKEMGLNDIDFEKCISRLVRQGYVRRGRGSQKRTYKYIYLTDEGKELFK